MIKFVTSTAAIGVTTIAFSTLISGKVTATTFNLEEATIADINSAFDAGILTSEQLVQLYLNRIEAFDNNGPKLNSFISLNPDALETAQTLDRERKISGAKSPLYGIPVLLKDNIDTSDLPTTAGSLALEGSIPPDDAFLTKQLRDAGAIVLGKANLTEFANFLSDRMPNGYSALGGFTFNPYNPTALPDGDGRPALSPGGSSSGSAVAVAANLVPVSVGTETDGSILSPANNNSVVGIKPTVGLISRDGVIPISSSQDTPGPFGRTVADAATTLGVLTGVDPSDPVTSASEGKFFKDYTQFLDDDSLVGTRIGVPKQFYDFLSEEELAITDNALNALESQGATLVFEEIPTAEAIFDLFSDDPVIPVLSYEFKAGLNQYLSSLGPDAPVKSLSDIIAFNNANPERALKYGQVIAEAADTIDLERDRPQYLEDRATQLRLAKDEGLDFFLNKYDLDAVFFPDLLGSTIGAIAGYPSINVPAGYTSTSPFGITFLGKAFSEPDLIGFAYDFEQATKIRRPPQSTPPLPGEAIGHETGKKTPEPAMILALGVLGSSFFGDRKRSLNNRTEITLVKL
jgi:amidase